MTSFASKTALIVGAGVSGLAAASALAPHFGSVIVIERDETLGGIMPRRGVPQGRLPHLLLCGGFEALSQLFPGLGADLSAAGAIAYTAGRDFRIELPGIGVLPARDFAFESWALRRTLLEVVLVRRLQALDKVKIRQGRRVVKFITSSDGMEVIGVQTLAKKDGALESHYADLVVDAAGHACLTIEHVKAKGLPQPKEQKIQVNVAYASAVATIRSFPGDDGVAIIVPPVLPYNDRMGYMLRLSPQKWHVLLVGRGADQPLPEADAFIGFAEGLASPTIALALRQAQALEEWARLRFAANVRYLWGAPVLPPKGLLPLGDAVCRFNPAYGQGMTVALQEALLLRQLLDGGASSFTTLSGEFYARCIPLIDRAWNASSLRDLIFPTTVGAAPSYIWERIEAQNQLLIAAMNDATSHRTYLEELNLLPPSPSCV